MVHDHEAARSGFAITTVVIRQVPYMLSIASICCVLVVLHIVVIIIGAIFCGQCTIEPLIPIFLISQGTFVIVVVVSVIALV